jgi:hypothetical protein
MPCPQVNMIRLCVISQFTTMGPIANELSAKLKVQETDYHATCANTLLLRLKVANFVPRTISESIPGHDVILGTDPYLTQKVGSRRLVILFQTSPVASQIPQNQRDLLQSTLGSKTLHGLRAQHRKFSLRPCLLQR